MLALLLLLNLSWGSISNQLLYLRLTKEAPASKRIALLNVSRELDPGFWNARYVDLALKSTNDLELEILANIIGERYTNRAMVIVESAMGKLGPTEQQSGRVLLAKLREQQGIR